MLCVLAMAYYMCQQEYEGQLVLYNAKNSIRDSKECDNIKSSYLGVIVFLYNFISPFLPKLRVVSIRNSVNVLYSVECH